MKAISILGQQAIRVAKKIPLLRRVNRYMMRLAIPRKIYIRGAKVRTPLILGSHCSITETWMIDLLEKLLKEISGAFLDVGVNLGQSLIKLKALEPERTYIGFEPNPLCVHYVTELIKENHFPNCTLLPVGLFTEDRVLSLQLFSDDPTDSMASLIENFRPDNKIHSRAFVSVFRFESISGLLDAGSIGIVKIDVEGAELEVVKSISGLINLQRPIVLLEILPVYNDANLFRKARQDELERIFLDANYAIFHVTKTNDMGYAGLQRLSGFGIHSDLTQCDYMLVPSELEPRVH